MLCLQTNRYSMGRGLKYKTIMNLDGGGILSLISARILQELEGRARKHTHVLFDVIVGSSTGGIPAAGLARPMKENGGGPCPADEMVQLYSERGREIFIRSP